MEAKYTVHVEIQAGGVAKKQMEELEDELVEQLRALLEDAVPTEFYVDNPEYDDSKDKSDRNPLELQYVVEVLHVESD